MEQWLTKLQRDFLKNHIKATKHDFYRTNKVKLKGKFVLEEDLTSIDAEKLLQVSELHQMLVAERDEIIDRYDVGELELMKFLLDREGLADLYREQLSLGLPLSYRQETKAYKDLKIEDEDSLVTVKESIRKLNKHQLTQLNALTPEARLIVIARLRDGRILGVLDEVLEAAPQLFADRGTPLEVAPNRLEERLVKRFEQEGFSGHWRQDINCLKDVEKLLKFVEAEILEPKVLVAIGRSLLTDSQREFWGGHTSFAQKVEISKHMLKGSNVVVITPEMKLPNKLRQQIDCGLPLTNQQMATFKKMNV